MSAEMPWFTGPVDAVLWWPEDRPNIGNLKFKGPDSHIAIIPVTRGDSNSVTSEAGTNVWHIEIDGDVATVSPSVHFIGRWHSPNPVKFHLVEELDA